MYLHVARVAQNRDSVVPIMPTNSIIKNPALTSQGYFIVFYKRTSLFAGHERYFCRCSIHCLSMWQSR